MAFVQHFKHDVFVSYAHVDDQIYPQQKEGWVTALVGNLKRKLSEKAGPDVVDVWMDYKLDGNVPFTNEIMDSLQNSATLLLILSAGFLNSSWCKREANRFLEVIRARSASGSQLFLVERVRIDKKKLIEDKELPVALNDLTGYRFWIDDRPGKEPRTLGFPGQDERYWDLIGDLAGQLERELKRQAGRPPVVLTGPAVLLADVTDDLDEQRNVLRRYLNQHALRILPAKNYYPVDNRKLFEDTLKADLRNPDCKLFVQLLSEWPGKKTEALPEGIVGFQFAQAKAAGCNILQWRSPELDLHKITDDAHCERLQGETVIPVSLEEFKARIVESTRPKPVKVERRPATKPDFVFLNAESGDHPLAEELAEVLKSEADFWYALPLQKGKAADIRADLEASLQDCDGLIIVYGSSPVVWVHEQLRHCRRTLAQRDRKIRALAIYEGPPVPKDEIEIKVPGLQILNCRDGLKVEELRSFLNLLQASHD